MQAPKKAWNILGFVLHTDTHLPCMHCRGGWGWDRFISGFHRAYRGNTKSSSTRRWEGDDWTKLQSPFFEHIARLVGVCLYLVCAYIHKHTHIHR